MQEAPMSNDPFKPALERAFGHALRHLSAADSAPVEATTSLAELRARFARPLPETGTDPSQVVDDLVRDAAGGILGSSGGRFFGWVIGGTLPAALAADWLVSTWDQNSGLPSPPPAIAAIEDAAGHWLLQLLGLPEESDVGFVTGATMANFTGLAAARWRL